MTFAYALLVWEKPLRDQSGCKWACARNLIHVQRAHRLLGTDAPDRLREQRSDRQLTDAPGAARLLRQWDRIGHDQLVERGRRNALDGIAGEQWVRDVRHHFHGTLILQSLRGLTQRSRGVDHVIDEHAGLALYLTDDVHHLGLIGARAAFVDDREIRIIETLRHGARTCDATHIRRHHDDVAISLLPGIAEQHRRGVHVVDRDVEESLNLIRVQIDGQQSPDACARDHVRNEFRGDRRARRARSSILARVTEVRHDRADARGRGTSARIDQHQQLHQVICHRRTRGLYDEYVAPAHVLDELDVHFAVAEATDLHAAHGRSQVARDVVRQHRIGIAREQRNRVIAHATLSMAGVEGFEPPNGGIKTRCLTTWRHPSIYGPHG